MAAAAGGGGEEGALKSDFGGGGGGMTSVVSSATTRWGSEKVVGCGSCGYDVYRCGGGVRLVIGAAAEDMLFSCAVQVLAI